jgi:hypothetical protein
MTAKKSFSIPAILLLALAFSSISSKAKSYTYIDGNNNDYEITSDSIFYSPIAPVESSSGEYSGGDPKRLKITEAQFLKIEMIIKSILKDKSNFIKDRLMGCGTLIAGKKTTYINSASQLKAELEQELKSYLN